MKSNSHHCFSPLTPSIRGRVEAVVVHFQFYCQSAELAEAPRSWATETVGLYWADSGSTLTLTLMDFYSSGEQRCPHAILIHMGIRNRRRCLHENKETEKAKRVIWKAKKQSYGDIELQKCMPHIGPTYVHAKQHQMITDFATPQKNLSYSYSN